PDVWEPVTARVLPAEQLAQACLHDAGIIEQLEIGIGDDEVGTARGSRSSHCKALRPGKRYMVTSQAVLVPIRRLRTPTPAVSPSVRRNAPGSTLATRCGQVSPLGRNAIKVRAMIGRRTISE